jgi:hypothetical protein
MVVAPGLPLSPRHNRDFTRVSLLASRRSVVVLDLIVPPPPLPQKYRSNP